MRLIDADALMQSMGCVDAVKYGNKTAEQQHNSYSTMMLYEIADYIDSAPTIDAAPVVHAWWKKMRRTEADEGESVWECSDCGYPVGIWTVGNKYCPNCGAKMDAKEAES